MIAPTPSLQDIIELGNGPKILNTPQCTNSTPGADSIQYSMSAYRVVPLHMTILKIFRWVAVLLQRPTPHSVNAGVLILFWLATVSVTCAENSGRVMSIHGLNHNLMGAERTRTNISTNHPACTRKTPTKENAAVRSKT